LAASVALLAAVLSKRREAIRSVGERIMGRASDMGILSDRGRSCAGELIAGSRTKTTRYLPWRIGALRGGQLMGGSCGPGRLVSAEGEKKAREKS
jgi:hypothetical protein